jgi:hypothetical protein
MNMKISNHSTLQLLEIISCTSKDNTKIVKFEGKTFEQKWAIRDLNPDLPSDWSAFEFFTFEMNASSTQRFFINLYDSSGMRRLRILPFQGAWVRASIPLMNFEKECRVGNDMAAIGQKGMPGFGLGFTGSVGPISHVDLLNLMEEPIGSSTLGIRNIHLTMTAEDSLSTPCLCR